MLKGNKGEWSEVYALFKLLTDGKLYPGDKDLQKIPNAFYPILSILRTEITGKYAYSINDDIVIISGEKELLRISIEVFKEKLKILFNSIVKKRDKAEGSFSIPEIEEFMITINCLTLKASSSVKTDIKIVVHDPRTNQQPILGFSIKSQLGGSSTLFNAVSASNFIYELNGNMDEKTTTFVNSMFIKRGVKYHRDVKGRTRFLFSKNIKLKLVGVEKPVFSNNLMLIDSLLPQILSEFVIRYYSGETSSVPRIVESLEEDNPLGYDISNKHKFYTYKIKHFLTDVALGMLPSKVWDGKYDATGGYLIVKNDGEIVCYHIYNKNEFEDYLVFNTKLETPSTSKFGFGDIYEEDGKWFYKLNLQIRFIK